MDITKSGLRRNMPVHPRFAKVGTNSTCVLTKKEYQERVVSVLMGISEILATFVFLLKVAHQGCQVSKSCGKEVVLFFRVFVGLGSKYFVKSQFKMCNKHNSYSYFQLKNKIGILNLFL